MQHPSLIVQLFSLIGALCCLIAYVAHQLHWMDSRKLTYNVLNVVGSGILAYIAFRPFQAGFLLMETIWALVSLYALLKWFRKRKEIKQP